jgi:uncharacterized iron-regulated membrane protein
MKLTKAEVYRLVWRWHFYAGLLVAPFLFILSLSGLVYLFNDEINDLLQADRRFVAPAAQSLPLSRIAEAALADYPGGRITRLDTPREPGRSIEVYVSPADGDPVRVFVDPGRGIVLGSHDYRYTIIGVADRMHGSLFLGDFGDAIVELAACWTFILVVTGLYLWWPRGEMSFWKALAPRWRLGGRPFWRSLHGATGVWVVLLALFLILSGLPWATIWGGLFRQATEAAGIGYPTSFRAYGAPAGAPIGLDKVAGIVAANGMSAPYRLNLPKGERGVFIVFTYPDQPEGQRSLYIDQYSGQVLGDVGYGDYGWAAKAIELGIQIHMGNYFGRLNQIVMAVPCVGLIVLSLTGPYMWWRRRPRGALGAPAVRSSAPIGAVALITLGLAVVFPLVGASLVVVGAIDLVQSRPRRAYAVRSGA